MQTLKEFYQIQCILNLYFLLDLAGLFRMFLSRMCLDEVLAGVAIFNKFFYEVHTKSFAPSSRQQRKNPSLLMCWLIISRCSYSIQLCTWIKGYLIFSISYCSIVREENTVQRWDTAYVFLDVGQSSQFGHPITECKKSNAYLKNVVLMCSASTVYKN